MKHPFFNARKVDLSLYDPGQFRRGRPQWFIALWWIVQSTIFRWSLQPMYGYRNALLRAFGAKIGRKVRIRADARFYYPWNVVIGDHSWIGNEAYFYSLDQIIVGAHCVISQQAYLSTGTHDVTDPAFGLIIKPVIIHDGAWVGARAFVNLGVTVHEHTVIGAMSMVTKDMPARMICAGNPCRPLKERRLIEHVPLDEELFELTAC